MATLRLLAHCFKKTSISDFLKECLAASIGMRDTPSDISKLPTHHNLPRPLENAA